MHSLFMDALLVNGLFSGRERENSLSKESFPFYYSQKQTLIKSMILISRLANESQVPHSLKIGMELKKHTLI